MLFNETIFLFFVIKLCSTIGNTKGVICKACEKLRQEGYISGKTDEHEKRIVVIAAVRHIETMTEASFFPGEDISF